MYKILLVLILLFFIENPSFAENNWNYVGTGVDASIYSIDLNTINSYKGYVIFWEDITPYKEGFLRARNIADCKNNSSSTLSLIYYNSHGSVEDNYTIKTMDAGIYTLEIMPPESMGVATLSYACKATKLIENGFTAKEILINQYLILDDDKITNIIKAKKIDTNIKEGIYYLSFKNYSASYNFYIKAYELSIKNYNYRFEEICYKLKSILPVIISNYKKNNNYKDATLFQEVLNVVDETLISYKKKGHI